MVQVIYYGIMLIIAVGTYLLGRYVTPNIPQDAMMFIEQWAQKFIAWAEDKMKDSTGQEKMQAVIKKLQEKAKAAGINLSDDDIYAIAQMAYDEIRYIIKKEE